MKARFAPEAKAELAETIRYLNAQHPGAGRRFAQAVSALVAVIRKHPGVGSPEPDGLRRSNLRHWSHYLLYQEEPDEIVILAVGHMSRMPDYWKGR